MKGGGVGWGGGMGVSLRPPKKKVPFKSAALLGLIMEL